MKNIFVVFLLTCSALLAGCENRDLRQLVKEMAEAPVDTTGMEHHSILLNKFSAVSIDCFADVTYHQTALTDTPSVRLRAVPEVLKNLRVKVDGGELQVGINHRYRMPDNAVALVDIYAPFVNRVNVSGAKCLRLGNVAVKSPLEISFDGMGAFTADTINTPEFYLCATGGASADVGNLQVQHLRVKQTDNSIVWLRGDCLVCDVDAQQDSLINISQLQISQP